MTSLPRWALLICGVLLTSPSLAADRVIAAPLTPEGYVVAAPALLPPCREVFWATSLYCVPRAEVYAPNDPALHSYLRSLRPVTRKPYMQVFHW